VECGSVAGWGLSSPGSSALASAVAVLAIPDKYEASARVYVDTQSILKPLMSGLVTMPNVDQQVMMLSRTLITRPNVEKLIRMADLDLKIESKRERDALVEPDVLAQDQQYDA
jgi:uncharacterized protein involved in exopolysaccharide biosynthesis